MTRDHGRIFFFTAKGSASFLLNDANLVGRKAEQIHQRLMNVVGALERARDRYTVLNAGGRNHPVWLDVDVFLRACRVLILNDVCSVRPNAVNIAFVHQIAFEDVVLTPDDNVLLQSFIDVEHGG